MKKIIGEYNINIKNLLKSLNFNFFGFTLTYIIFCFNLLYLKIHLNLFFICIVFFGLLQLNLLINTKNIISKLTNIVYVDKFNLLSFKDDEISQSLNDFEQRFHIDLTKVYILKNVLQFITFILYFCYLLFLIISLKYKYVENDFLPSLIMSIPCVFISFFSINNAFNKITTYKYKNTF